MYFISTTIPKLKKKKKILETNIFKITPHDSPFVAVKNTHPMITKRIFHDKNNSFYKN